MSDEWDRFVDASPQGCIFQKSWWLEAVAPGAHDLLLVRKGDDIAAGMPLVWQGEGARRALGMPQLTQVLGVLFRDSSAKPVRREAREQDLALGLVERIPSCASFSQRFHHGFRNWLPFHWDGYTQTTRYTYVLDDLSDLETVWSGMRSNIRGDARKAEKQGVRIRDDLGLDSLYDALQATFRRQGLTISYSAELVRRIASACESRDACQALFAVDDQGRVHAAGFFVWDHRTTYYLMGGGDPELRSSGATSLLLWHAIQAAAARGTAFDFEGSMLRGVQGFFQAFGAVARPYSEISRTNSLLLEGSTFARSYARRAARHWRRRSRGGVHR